MQGYRPPWKRPNACVSISDMIRMPAPSAIMCGGRAYAGRRCEWTLKGVARDSVDIMGHRVSQECHTLAGYLTFGRLTMGMLNFDTVRELGLALPDVVDGAAYGARALKLNGKLLACIPVNKSAELNSIVVHIDIEQRAELLRQQPDIYYITDHYAPHPTVLVRLSRITRADLRALLRDAHRFVTPSAPKTAIATVRPKSATRRSGARKKPRKR